MTDADKPAFAAAMARLCVALREKDPDAAQLRAYFDTLIDVPIEFVIEAGTELQRTSNWFPRAPEWRITAKAIEHRRRIEQRQRLRQSGVLMCIKCDDTGFVIDPETSRASRCDCQIVRQQELLGQRPMPALPPATPEPDPTQFERVKGMIKPAIKAMPRPRLITPEFEKAAEDDPILAAELERRRPKAEAQS